MELMIQTIFEEKEDHPSKKRLNSGLHCMHWPNFWAILHSGQNSDHPSFRHYKVIITNSLILLLRTRDEMIFLKKRNRSLPKLRGIFPDDDTVKKNPQ